MCGCRKRIQEGIKEKHGLEGYIDFELLSGKTYSNFRYKEVNRRGKETERILSISHSYCPFCGEKYETKVQGGESDVPMP